MAQDEMIVETSVVTTRDYMGSHKWQIWRTTYLASGAERKTEKVHEMNPDLEPTYYVWQDAEAAGLRHLAAAHKLEKEEKRKKSGLHICKKCLAGDIVPHYIYDLPEEPIGLCDHQKKQGIDFIKDDWVYMASIPGNVPIAHCTIEFVKRHVKELGGPYPPEEHIRILDREGYLRFAWGAIFTKEWVRRKLKPIFEKEKAKK